MPQPHNWHDACEQWGGIMLSSAADGVTRVAFPTPDFEAARRGVEALGGALRLRFDARWVGAELPWGVTDNPWGTAYRQSLSSVAEGDEPPPLVARAIDAWLGVAPSRSGAPAAGTTAPLDGAQVVGVVFVWPELGHEVVAEQQRQLVRHVLGRAHHRKLTRLWLAEHEDQQAAWTDAKREALAAMGGFPDTKRFAAALLTCDPGLRYDTATVYFFAPYRLQRSQATIIREERHGFSDVVHPRRGAPMRRHVAMVRLASPEVLASEVA